MVNVSDLNVTEIVDNGSDKLEWIVGPIQEISTFVQDKIKIIGIEFPGILSTILTIAVGVLLIFIGAKITSKVAKFILWVLGGILIIGIVLSVISSL